MRLGILQELKVARYPISQSQSQEHRMTPLRQRMIEDMQLRNLAQVTQRNYIAHVAAFAKFFGKSPEYLDQEAVREYLLYLLNERKLSPARENSSFTSGHPGRIPEPAGRSRTAPRA